MTLNWMQQYVGEELLEEHQAGRFDRRELLRRLAAVCGSAAAALSVFLAVCGDDGTATPATSSSTTGTGSAATTRRPPPHLRRLPPRPPSPDRGVPRAAAVDDPAVRGADVTFPGRRARCSATWRGRRRPVRGRPGGAREPRPHRSRPRRHPAARELPGTSRAPAVDLASRAGGTAKAGDGVSVALTNGSPADPGCRPRRRPRLPEGPDRLQRPTRHHRLLLRRRRHVALRRLATGGARGGALLRHPAVAELGAAGVERRVPRALRRDRQPGHLDARRSRGRGGQACGGRGARGCRPRVQQRHRLGVSRAGGGRRVGPAPSCGSGRIWPDADQRSGGRSNP